MIDAIISGVMSHFGFTEEHADKIKAALEMVELKEENGKKFALVKLGDSVEIKIFQPENK
jgi:hypothetical protein